MSWNYRIIETRFDTESRFGIHEVFYYEDGSIRCWTESPVDVSWCVDDFDDPRIILDRMREAFDKPILYVDDLPR